MGIQFSLRMTATAATPRFLLILCMLLCVLLDCHGIDAECLLGLYKPPKHQPRTYESQPFVIGNKTGAVSTLNMENFKATFPNASTIDFANLVPRVVDTSFLNEALNPEDPANWDDFALRRGENSPMLRSNWAGQDGWCKKEFVKRNFVDVLELAQAALDYILTEGPWGPSYMRYFALQKTQDVLNAYRVLFNDIKKQKRIDKGGVASPDFLFLDIRNDAPRGILNGQYDSPDDNCIEGNSLAYFQNALSLIAPGIVTDRRRAMLVLCPRIFRRPDLPTGEYDPSRCDMFDGAPYATFDMRTLSSQLLHEFLHYDYMQAWFTTWRPILDYAAENDKNNPEQDPPNGYGPWNTMRMQQRGFDVLSNADSFTYFALEAWWQKKYGITLENPPKNTKTYFSGSSWNRD